MGPRSFIPLAILLLASGILSAQEEGGFEQRDIIFANQYFINAPKHIIDEIAQLEAALPPGAAKQIVRQKRLPDGLCTHVRPLNKGLSMHFTPPIRGNQRGYLGHRLIELDPRKRIVDMMYIPLGASAPKPPAAGKSKRQ